VATPVVFGERQAPSLTPISESEMSPTSPTILDDLDIPKRTAHLAVMGKGGFHLFPFGGHKALAPGGDEPAWREL